jgi:hypothetical protein
VVGNNTTIRTIKDNSNEAKKMSLESNELTQKQIKALINKVNHNDVLIMTDHKNIKNEMKEVDRASKIRSENVDTRLRGFKNITNANVIAMNNKMSSNNKSINNRTDLLKRNFERNIIKTNSTLATMDVKRGDNEMAIETNRLTSSSGISSANGRIDEMSLLMNSKNQQLLSTINQKLITSFDESLSLSDNQVKGMSMQLSNIGQVSEQSRQSITNDYQKADSNIRNDMGTLETRIDSEFIKDTQLLEKVNQKFFSGSDSMSSLIAKSTLNSADITSLQAANDSFTAELNNFPKIYLKDDELKQKLEDLLPTTQTHRDTALNTAQIELLRDGIRKNEANNDTLSDTLRSMKGGLSGEINLKSLTEQISANAIKISQMSSSTKAELRKERNSENLLTQAKIAQHTTDIGRKLNNTPSDYKLAFDNYITKDQLMGKFSNELELNKLKTNNIVTNSAIINGVNFDTIARKVLDQPSTNSVGAYEKDFESGPFLKPNKSILMKRGLDMELEGGKMNIINGNFNWRNNGSSVEYNSQGQANFNVTAMNIGDFSKIKDSSSTSLTKFIDDKVSLGLSTNTPDNNSSINAVNSANIKPTSVTTPYLYIGTEASKFDLNKKVDDLKATVEGSLQATGIRDQDLYKKSDNNALFDNVALNMKTNPQKYLPARFPTVNSFKLKGDTVEVNDVSKIMFTYGSTNLREHLEGTYVKQTDYQEDQNGGNGVQPITDITLDSANNLKYKKNGSDNYTSIGQIQTGDGDSGGIKNISLDQANNRLITTSSNGLSYVDLPDYKTSIPQSMRMTDYMKTATADNQYAKNQIGGNNPVYLSTTKTQQLDNILQNLNLQSVADIPRPETISNIQSKVSTNSSEIDSLKKTLPGQINSRVTLSTLNDNITSNDSFLRLNNEISIKATNDSLQVCRGFANGKPTTCFNLWDKDSLTNID